jgi:hypothetical protein
MSGEKSNKSSKSSKGNTISSSPSSSSSSINTSHGVPTATPPSTSQESKSQDLRAVDFYQKGIEISHSANSYEEHMKAIEILSVAIALRSNQPRFFLARGNSFRAVNDFENAAKDFSMAIALDDRTAVYYANRGACYRKACARNRNTTVGFFSDISVLPCFFSR